MLYPVELRVPPSTGLCGSLFAADSAAFVLVCFGCVMNTYTRTIFGVLVGMRLTTHAGFDDGHQAFASSFFLGLGITCAW